MSVPQAPGSPAPSRSGEVGEVGTELQRVIERWRQLPLDHALLYAGRVRALVQSLADRVAEKSGIPPSVVPDLGPATLMDQLSVMVYDANPAAQVHDASATALTSTLANDLASLRRELR